MSPVRYLEGDIEGQLINRSIRTEKEEGGKQEEQEEEEQKRYLTLQNLG
jgi:fructose-1,6-bisphosphatase/sedoheptulose 1,7-bisphosphatase-like protein